MQSIGRGEPAVNVSFLQDLLNSVAEQGRQLLPWGLGEQQDIVALARALISGRGEASGVALARQILELWHTRSPGERRDFYRFLAEGIEPEPQAVQGAARAYLEAPSKDTLGALQLAVESPRQEFFRRLNLAPGATAGIVEMRRDILRLIGDMPELKAVDADLRHLLVSWFNRGFLVLRRIDWNTPAVVLEKIIAYEAVHEIKGWKDLRRRLEPADRRCFAFFHPSLIDEPLIFVEVALTTDTPSAIAPLLAEEGRRDPRTATKTAPTTAVFYSISNCQDGLKGISFGNFLIKQVVEELARELPTLTTFVTLSPVPGFARWLNRALTGPDTSIVSAQERTALATLTGDAWLASPQSEARLAPIVLALGARYLLSAKGADGRPADPVARFHLGNGARLERVNWPADRSDRGLREAHGLMVNYRYDLKEIEANHEAYANEGRVVASRHVRGLLRSTDKVPMSHRLIGAALEAPASLAGSKPKQP
jgi:malonyl-CoA decarboxylase